MTRATQWKIVCPYCGEKTQSGHMVPASFGDPNTLICDTINRIEQERGMAKNRDWCVVAVSDTSRGETNG